MVVVGSSTPFPVFIVVNQTSETLEDINMYLDDSLVKEVKIKTLKPDSRKNVSIPSTLISTNTKKQVLSIAMGDNEKTTVMEDFTLRTLGTFEVVITDVNSGVITVKQITSSDFIN